YQQHKIDDWLDTLDEALKRPDYGLAHSRIENTIAWHFLREREPTAALPHAEAAAQSYAAWALLTAATTYECLQQFEKAETVYRATSERYVGSGSGLCWYFFCCRTGKGDMVAARQLAATSVDDPNTKVNPFDVICYRLLNDQTPEALELLEGEFKKDPHP